MKCKLHSCPGATSKTDLEQESDFTDSVFVAVAVVAVVVVTEVTVADFVNVVVAVLGDGEVRYVVSA